MTLKRDRVNRVKGLVYLPIDGSRVSKGEMVLVTHVKEEPIDCEIRDAMEMEEPVNGDAIGDAVFDAMSPPVVIGDNTSDEARDMDVEFVIGFEDGNCAVLLDTSDDSGLDTDNVCDPMLNDE